MARTMLPAGAKYRSEGSLKALHRAIVGNSVKAKQILDGNRELKLNELVEGATALIRACCYGRTPVIRELLSRNDIDINIRFTKDGSTALMCACSTERQSTEAVNLLLAFPHVDVNTLSESHGFTALMYAVCKGHEDVVHALLEHPDVAVNVVSKDGKTALMYAAEMSFLPIVEALLEHPSVDVTLTDKKGKTALDLAVEPEVEFVLRAQTTQVPSGGSLRAMIGVAAPRPRLSAAIASPVRSPVPHKPSSTSPRGAAFAPVDLTSDAEDESDDGSGENENEKEGEGGSSSDGESASEADEEESNVVSSAGSHGSDSGSASGSGSSSGSSSESESDTDDELVLPVQDVALPVVASRPAQAHTTTPTITTTTSSTERTWLAARLLEAGYGEQDVTTCEQRIIHEQRFISEAVYAMSTNLDDAALLSIGVKELGLRAFLLDLQRVLHSKRGAALVITVDSRPAKRVRST